MSRYSSYRSPYLDTSTSTSSSSTGGYDYSGAGYSSFYHPSYESKFDSVVSRNPEGRARSRAGTSTKYDYLSTYTSPVLAKYAAGGPSSSSSSTYNSSNYASLINTDELTKSYFEKYYSSDKPSAKSSALSSVLDNHSSSPSSRMSRASSVYLGSEEKPSVTARTASTASDTYTPRSYRSSSVSIEPATNISDLAAETVRSRFNRTLSIYDDSPSSNSEKPSQNGVTDVYTSRFNRTYSIKRDDENGVSEKPSRYGTTNGDYKSSRRESIVKEPSPPLQKTYGGYSRATDDTDSEAGYTSVASRYRQRQSNRFAAEEVDKAEVESDSDSSGSGAAGLRNIGNTCFMNSVLQCLGSTKLLMSYLLKDSYTQDINTSNSAMKGSLVKAFATVIKSLWKGGGRIVDPSSLKGAINRFAPRFSGYNQEDSQEFLRYLLEGLHEDVNRVLTKPQPINTEIDSSLSVCEQAMEAWKRYLRRDNSYLVDMFVGQLRSTLKCRECGHESVTFEPFWDISLPIPSKSGEVSLLDCFDSFTSEEVLAGDEMPTCEQCKTRRECTKRFSIYKLPKVLVLHLKRFSPTERYRQKLSTVVKFPLTGLSLPCDTSLSTSHFDCYAVSNHSGTLYSGHYTAYAKSPQSGQWYSYNDSRVSKCSSSSVMSNENYLLFFEMSS